MFRSLRLVNGFRLIRTKFRNVPNHFSIHEMQHDLLAVLHINNPLALKLLLSEPRERESLDTLRLPQNALNLFRSEASEIIFSRGLHPVHSLDIRRLDPLLAA